MELGTAEEVPLPDAAVDVVAVGQAFHWFDHERALPEIARVLRPGGVLALVWNARDESEPWVARLTQIIEPGLSERMPESVLEEALALRAVRPGGARDVRIRGTARPGQLLALVSSRSHFVRSPDQRAAILRTVSELRRGGRPGRRRSAVPHVCPPVDQSRRLTIVRRPASLTTS